MSMDEQTPKSRPGLLSLVIPLYNEQAVIAAFHSRLVAVLERIESPAEIVYVNDGSTDRSLSLLLDLRQRDERIAIVDLSRNFGKELALTAGLDHARGDAVVLIDADLQDPPEVIPELLKGWDQGYDVVSARRIAREGETWLHIPVKLTDESDDVDRVESCGAWWSDFSAVGHHRRQFSVLEGRCTTAGQPGRPARVWTEAAGHWVASLVVARPRSRLS
jgi:glycosyltransferase involved in cell wall biosynthesis